MIRKPARRTVERNRKGGGKRGSRSQYGAVLALATIPFFIGTAPLIGWLIGRWVDSKAGTDLAFQVVGVALGLGAAVRETVRLVRRAQRDLDKE